MLTMRSHTREGFTLMEILIAVLIIGLLGAVVGPGLLNLYRGAQKRAAKSTLKSLKTGIDLYKLHVGKYPAKLSDLLRKPREEAAARKWEGPYWDKEELPEDPWNERYEYKPNPPGAKRPYELYSWGPNGRGAPKEEHISAWE